MMLDDEQCYRALLARDARFDGKFFTGVVTTGIYCRPVCPAPKPHRRNVRFFLAAAAAAEAGFRPCLRCRPEASPGTPGWLGTEATVRRAMRHIADGALDRQSTEELARRLGIGERHLRRLFQNHFGASPDSIARTRRLLFAKKLIDETRLPMTDVALSAGYSSVRRFNAAIRDSYGRAPTALRAKGRVAVSSDADGSDVTLTLAVRPPFDWQGILRFLGPRAIPGVESVGPDGYRRTFRSGTGQGMAHVRPVAGKDALTLNVRGAEAPDLLQVVQRTRRLFDLDADPLAITDHLALDPTLGPLVRRSPGLRVPGAWDLSELALRAVLGQQITVAGATTLSGRLARHLGTPLSFDGGAGLEVVFPSAEEVAAADLSAIGLPRARQEALRLVAAACVDTDLGSTGSLDELIAGWTAIPGVGDWTAHYVAMRAYSEPDAFPASDLGLRKALAHDGKLPAAKEVGALAERWRPWRSYAAMHLWNGLSA